MSARLPVLSGTKLIEILVREGFIIRRRSGSLDVMQEDERVFAVPLHDELEERDIEKRFRKQAGLDVENPNIRRSFPGYRPIEVVAERKRLWRTSQTIAGRTSLISATARRSNRHAAQDSARPWSTLAGPTLCQNFGASTREGRVQLQDVKHLLVTRLQSDHAGLAKEMKQKGVVLVVNGKPTILYPEAALLSEAGRILTSKSDLKKIST
jgi:hypothetical protein